MNKLSKINKFNDQSYVVEQSYIKIKIKNVLAKSNSNSIGNISITLLIFLNYRDRLDYDNLNEECTEISDEFLW